MNVEIENLKLEILTMKIIRVHKKISLKVLQEIGILLRNGGVIVYPTDTAYAMGGIFDNAKVIKKILQMKKRKDAKFTLIASDIRQVEKLFSLNTFEKKLAKKYWPGPLSLVISKKYAVRVPKNACARSLARIAQCPLIASSANISGKDSPFSIREFLQQHKNNPNKPEYILDYGKLIRKKPSTIVKVNTIGTIKIIRKGEIPMLHLLRPI